MMKIPFINEGNTCETFYNYIRIDMKSISIAIKKNVIKVVFESSLIIFSVLLALFLNEYREELAKEKEKERALEMVRVELKSNLETLNQWLPYHKKIVKNLTHSYNNLSLNQNDELSIEEQYDLITSLMPQGVVQTALVNSSWEAIKQSNLSSTIDLDIVFSLSKLFKLQSLGIEKTLQRTLTTLTSHGSSKKGNLKTTIFLLKRDLNELVSQEFYMIEVYKALIKKIELLDKENEG